MEEILESEKFSTRQKILRLLKLGGPKTVDELCQALEISSMGVRQHLISLEGEGLIRHHTEKGDIGRPRYVYTLTRAGDEQFTRTYPQLALELIDTLRALEGETGIDRVFDERTRHLAAEYRARMGDRPLKERVAELARIRSEEGYMAEWEQLDTDTFLLHEHNCAIYRVACDCEQACISEEELFRHSLADADVTRETHIVSGDRTCTYRIQRKQ